jgi:hypothetical protein
MVEVHGKDRLGPDSLAMRIKASYMSVLVYCWSTVQTKRLIYFEPPLRLALWIAHIRTAISGDSSGVAINQKSFRDLKGYPGPVSALDGASVPDWHPRLLSAERLSWPGRRHAPR